MQGISDLEQELAAILSQYEGQFAGRLRSSRSLATIDRLIRRLTEVLARIEQWDKLSPAEKLEEMREVAESNLKMYEKERAAIETAQEAGPDYDVAADLSDRANQVFARYHRHFAGLSRNTRDLALLDEMLGDLHQIAGRMEELTTRNERLRLAEDLGVVRHHIELYRRERRVIDEAQQAGTSEERANLLAGLANEQMRLYRVHFAGRSRLGRRPGLLMRIIGSLREVRAQMAALRDEGMGADFHLRNIEVVESSLRLYEAEIQEIRALRERTALGEILHQLGHEANAIFQEYEEGFSGKDRARVDLALLADLADRLGEIGRQMREILAASPSEEGAHDLDVVMNHLLLFDREYPLIQQRQAQQRS